MSPHTRRRITQNVALYAAVAIALLVAEFGLGTLQQVVLP
jgi:hypothetical protein